MSKWRQGIGLSNRWRRNYLEESYHPYDVISCLVKDENENLTFFSIYFLKYFLILDILADKNLVVDIHIFPFCNIGNKKNHIKIIHFKFSWILTRRISLYKSWCSSLTALFSATTHPISFKFGTGAQCYDPLIVLNFQCRGFNRNR